MDFKRYKDLSLEQKKIIYDNNKKSALIPIIVNILCPLCLGSLVQGDTKTFKTYIFLILFNIVLMFLLASSIMKLYMNMDINIYFLILFISAALLIVIGFYMLFMIIRNPIKFAKDFNDKLIKDLNIYDF